MALQEPVYTFNRTSERIAEFKGYNARSIRNDGEMRDMSGLTADEYPMLSVAKKPITYGENAFNNVVQMLSKSHIDADGNMLDILYVIAADSGGTYRLYRDGVLIKGLELSEKTQMVAINDKLCFYPEKKWYKVTSGEIGSIEGIVSRSEIAVTIADDEKNNYFSSMLKFDEDMGFTSQFKVGDVVTINCDIAGSKMLLYRSRNESDGTDGGLGIMMEPQYDLYIRTYIPTGWSGSFKIPLAIPHNVKSDSFSVKYSTHAWMDTWDMPAKGASDPDGKGIFYELDSTAGEFVTISSTNYKGAFINEIHIKLYPVRRSYYLPFTQSDKEITLLDGLYVSPSFATQAEALSWAETNYPADIADFESKKSAWSLLYEKNAISLRQGTSKPDAPYYLKYADVGPDKVDINGDVELVIDYGYIKETINPISAGIDGISAEIKAVTDTSISFPDNTFHDVTGKQLSGQTFTFSPFTISRPSPNLDYVIEWNNRLWGCSNKDNTIYASKLGDPTNWQYYQTTALDSYFAEQGSNGRWTGVGKYSTHLLFFKEDCVHKVYGSYPSEFQIVTQMCSGVKEGSSKSVVTMEDGVFYHSRRGIMGYSGGIPSLISTEFGSIKYSDAVAGSDNSRYYVSMKDSLGAYHLFTYDVDTGLWHRYGALNISDMEYHHGGLKFALRGENALIQEFSDAATEYADNWYANFGPFDEWVEEHKIYSKVKIRYRKYGDATFNVELSIDEGAWEAVQLVTSENENSGFIEFVPERCDRFSIRLSGSGRCEIKSITREFRQGTMAKENY